MKCEFAWPLRSFSLCSTVILEVAFHVIVRCGRRESLFYSKLLSHKDAFHIGSISRLQFHMCSPVTKFIVQMLHVDTELARRPGGPVREVGSVSEAEWSACESTHASSDKLL